LLNRFICSDSRFVASRTLRANSSSASRNILAAVSRSHRDCSERSLTVFLEFAGTLFATNRDGMAGAADAS
jgi:hypothetical protein